MAISTRMFVVIAILSQIQLIAAQGTNCATCPSPVNGIACTGLRAWRYCFGSMIDSVDRFCADDEICSTITQKWCMPDMPGGPIEASCNGEMNPVDNCNKCTEFGKNDFACLGKNRFARCMSGGPSQEYQGDCPTGYICSTESANMCVSDLKDDPTCPN